MGQQLKPIVGLQATHTWALNAATLRAMARSARKILAENLTALMKYHEDASSQKAVRDKSRVGGGTFDGAVNATSNTTLDSLEKLARAFGLQPYQLLIPDLDPKNPLIARLPPNEKAFYKNIEDNLRVLQEQVAEYRAKVQDP